MLFNAVTIDVFGHDNVHIIIFDDFKRDTAVVYRETLRFLAVSPDFQPDFQIVNSNKRPRSKSLYNFLLSPPQFARSVVRAVMPFSMRDALIRGFRWLNTAEVPRPAMSRELRKRLQAEFLPEVEQLSELLGRDLTHWRRD